MKRGEFEALVHEGFEQLPAWVRKKIKNVGLLVEDKPDEAVRREEGLGPDETLLGLYRGIPLSARGGEYGIGMTLPDTITLYQKPIEEAARDEKRTSEVLFPRTSDVLLHEAIRKVIADTIWHEFAHHFGMDEPQVRARERERGTGEA